MRRKEEKEANGTSKHSGTSTSSGTNTSIKEEKRKGDQELEKKKVPFFKLFAFADGFDVVMMVVGAVAAMANGMSQPMMTFIFGNVIDAFGGGTEANVLHRVTKACFFFFFPPDYNFKHFLKNDYFLNYFFLIINYTRSIK
jgi:hypothetical protein